MATVPNSTKDAQLVQAALGYADHGLLVFPVHSVVVGRCTCADSACNNPGKHPLTRNGLLDATDDGIVIRAWWAEAPQANVAIRTGEESRVWVLDVDGTAGLKDLETLEFQHGPLPVTPTVRTGGGGRHVYFAWPEDRNVQNRTKCHGMSIDVRGQGGYVVAPPSDHKSGGYVWERDIGEINPPPAPAWLLKWVTNEGSHSQTLGAGRVLVVQGDDLASTPGAPEGQRHNQLCRLAGHHLQRGDHLKTVELLALDWAKRCTPPLSGNETLRTVRDLATSHEKGLNSLSSHNSQVSDDEVENLELPPERAWPTLHPNALQGLAGDIIRRIEPQTEADPAAEGWSSFSPAATYFLKETLLVILCTSSITSSLQGSQSNWGQSSRDCLMVSPSVLRPFFTISAVSFVRRSTISGFSLAMFFVSLGSFARL